MFAIRVTLIVVLLAGCNSLNTANITVVNQAPVDKQEGPETRVIVRETATHPPIRKSGWSCKATPPRQLPVPAFPANEVKLAVKEGDQRSYDALLFKHIRDLSSYIEENKKEQARYTAEVRRCGGK